MTGTLNQSSDEPQVSIVEALPKAIKPVRWWQIEDEEKRKKAAKYVALTCSIIRSVGAGLLFYYTVIRHFSFLEGVAVLGLAACAGKAYMSQYQYNDTLETKLFKFFSPKKESEKAQTFFRAVFGIFYAPELAYKSASFSTEPSPKWKVDLNRVSWMTWVFFAIAGETVAVFTSAQKVFSIWFTQFNSWLDSMHQSGIPVELAWAVAGIFALFTVIVGMGLVKDSIEKKERLQDPLVVAGDLLVENIQKRQKLLDALSEAFSEKWSQSSSKKKLDALNAEIPKIEAKIEAANPFKAFFLKIKLNSVQSKRNALDIQIRHAELEAKLEWENLSLDQHIKNYERQIQALDNTSAANYRQRKRLLAHELAPLLQKRQALKIDMQVLEREQLRVQIESLKLLHIRQILNAGDQETSPNIDETAAQIQRKEAALAAFNKEVQAINAADAAERARWFGFGIEPEDTSHVYDEWQRQEAIERSKAYLAKHKFADTFGKVFGYFCSGLRMLGIIAITAGTITALFNGMGGLAIGLGAGMAFLLGGGRGKASYRLYTPELTDAFTWLGLKLYEWAHRVDEAARNLPDPILHQYRPEPVPVAKLGFIYRFKKAIINQGLVGGVMAMWGAVSEGMSMGISVVGLPAKILSILVALNVLDKDTDISNPWIIAVKVLASLVGLVSAACVGFGLPRNKLLQQLGVSHDAVDEKSEQLELLGKQNWRTLNEIEQLVKKRRAELSSETEWVQAPSLRTADSLKNMKGETSYTLIQEGFDERGLHHSDSSTSLLLMSEDEVELTSARVTPSIDNGKITRKQANEAFLTLNHKANQQTFALQSKIADSHRARIDQAGFSKYVEEDFTQRKCNRPVPTAA